MSRRRYTATEKAAAVGLAVVKGQRPTAEALGIPLSTLETWYQKPEFVHLRTTAREEVAESMWAAVQLGIASMVRSLDDPKVPLRDKTDAASMLTEKYLLLTGQATMRTENRELVDQMDDHEREALRKVLDAVVKEAV